MGAFSYDPVVTERFPNTRGGVIHVEGLINGKTSEDLTRSYMSAQKATRKELGDTPLSEVASIAAWRRTFSGFGVKPTQYRNAAESLLRRLTKTGHIPSINAVVDIANLVSITHRLPVAVFDQVGVTGQTTVRFASGEEEFTDLGSGETTHPTLGEVVFVDEVGLVSARRWCWRQSRESAAHAHTTEALITVESQHDQSGDAVVRAVHQLLGLLQEHQPNANCHDAVLTPGAPKFEF